HVVTGETPIPLGVEIAKRNAALQAQLDGGGTEGHFPRYKLEAAARAFMIEQDPGRGMQVVALAVVDGQPVAVDLGYPVRAAGIEGCALVLGYFDHLAEHLA